MEDSDRILTGLGFVVEVRFEVTIPEIRECIQKWPRINRDLGEPGVSPGIPSP